MIHFASSCMCVPKSFTEVLFSCPLSIKEKNFFRFTVQNPSDELSLPEELTLFSDLHSLQFSVPRRTPMHFHGFCHQFCPVEPVPDQYLSSWRHFTFQPFIPIGLGTYDLTALLGLHAKNRSSQTCPLTSCHLAVTAGFSGSPFKTCRLYLLWSKISFWHLKTFFFLMSSSPAFLLTSFVALIWLT